MHMLDYKLLPAHLWMQQMLCPGGPGHLPAPPKCRANRHADHQPDRSADADYRTDGLQPAARSSRHGVE
jgi:hypothetical protein